MKLSTEITGIGIEFSEQDRANLASRAATLNVTAREFTQAYVDRLSADFYEDIKELAKDMDMTGVEDARNESGSEYA